MGNQYGFTGLTPGNALRREAYRKGLLSGRRTTYYDEESRVSARKRFETKYGEVGTALRKEWEEGWRDAHLYRDWDYRE